MSFLARSTALPATAVAAMLAATATPGLAQTTYSGTGAAATAASASFAGAIGLSMLETFDARTDGELAPAWTYAGSETATLSNGFGVTSAYPYGGGAVSGTKGYGAYPNGGIGGLPVFSFSSALSAFGAYFVDIELADTLIFSLTGGETRSYVIPLGGDGGVAFFGVDFGANTITGVTFNVGFDEAFLIDDVRVASRGAVPEPTTWALLIGGFGAVGATLRRRRGATA